MSSGPSTQATPAPIDPASIPDSNGNRLSGLEASNLPGSAVHERAYSFNSKSALVTTVQVGPYEISISADKKSVRVTGEGLMFFSSRDREHLVSFKGRPELSERAQSMEGVQMEIGRLEDKSIMAIFRREDSIPIAQLLIKKTSAGIKFDLNSPFGRWVQFDGFVGLVENDLSNTTFNRRPDPAKG